MLHEMMASVIIQKNAEMSWGCYCLDPKTMRSYSQLQLIGPLEPRLLNYSIENELLETPVTMKEDKSKSEGKAVRAGRPLAMAERWKILALYERGHKISHIARIIGVTHSCISKIMSRYRRTGSMCPRSVRPESKSDSEFSDGTSQAASELEESAVKRPCQPLPYSIERLLA